MSDIEVRLQRAGRALREFDPEPPPLSGSAGATRRSGAGIASLAFGLVAVVFGVGILNGDNLPTRLSASAPPITVDSTTSTVFSDQAATVSRGETAPPRSDNRTSGTATAPGTMASGNMASGNMAPGTMASGNMIVPDVREEILLIRSITPLAAQLDPTSGDVEPITIARDPRLAVMF